MRDQAQAELYGEIKTPPKRRMRKWTLSNAAWSPRQHTQNHSQESERDGGWHWVTWRVCEVQTCVEKRTLLRRVEARNSWLRDL